MRPESQGAQAEAMDSPTETASGQDPGIIPRGCRKLPAISALPAKPGKKTMHIRRSHVRRHAWGA
jgi:hypothetical protein